MRSSIYIHIKTLSEVFCVNAKSIFDRWSATLWYVYTLSVVLSVIERAREPKIHRTPAYVNMYALSHPLDRGDSRRLRGKKKTARSEGVGCQLKWNEKPLLSWHSVLRVVLSFLASPCKCASGWKRVRWDVLSVEVCLETLMCLSWD